MIVCVSAIGIYHALADGQVEIVTYQIDPEDGVELDGDSGGEFSVSLTIYDDYYDINKIEGYFDEISPYIIASECSVEVQGPQEVECNANTGHFSFKYDGDGYGSYSPYETLFTMHYIVSPDAPAGVYDMSIRITDLSAQYTWCDPTCQDCEFFDSSVIRSSLYDTSLTVKTPQEVIFEDADGNRITEITKYYGDDDFIITKDIVTGDGEIIGYGVEDGADDSVAYSIPDSDLIHINGVGSVQICAWVDSTDLYLETISCFTVNVEKRPVFIHSASIADKEYDGTTEAELYSISFYQDTSEDPGYYIPIDIDPAYYDTNIILDDPNVGERWATVEIVWNEEGNERYRLMDVDPFLARATVNPARLNDIYGSIEPQEYNPNVDYQILDTSINASLLEDLGTNLEEGVDYELLWEGQKMYDEIWLTEVGDYDITISPLQGSNFTFEPFETTFTIYPKIITINGADVDDKTFDRTGDTSVSSVSFEGASLSKGVDYDAYASIGGSDVGVYSAIVYVTLINHNYAFDYEYYLDLDSYIYQDSYDEVTGVQIFPKTLTYENTYYEAEGDSYAYTGEEIKPYISLFIAFVDGESPDDELSLGYDYDIVYPNDTINVGFKYATLVGKNNFSGQISSVEYFIFPASVQDVEATTPSYTYTGESMEPEPTVTAIFNDNRITLPVSDYDIVHDGDFVDAGVHTYWIQESNAGNYHFSYTEATLTINPYEISSSDVSLSEDMYKYNGSSQTPSVTVTVGETTIDENDYDVEFSDDTIGNDEGDTEVTVMVTAKEGTNITGSASTTYVITPRELLIIAGVVDNQRIEYTGSPVVLDGNAMVEENEGGITAEDLTVTWYASDGTTVVDRPTNAGSYKVVYSYEDADYHGALVVNFEITKIGSPSPAEMDADFRIASEQTLADLEGERTIGFAWVDSGTTIIVGNNYYPATYTYNGDTTNYETLNLNVPVYGLAQVNVITTDSEGGEISVPSQIALEGETLTVTITPDFGFVLNSITVNGVNYIGSVDANTLAVVVGTDDLEIVATFVPIVYEVIEGAEQTYTIDEDGEIEFRINANYELFADGGAVYVDDVLVNPLNYTSWNGSTYIKFTSDYVKTLAVGAHTLKVVFVDGGSATTTFYIAEPEDDGDKDDKDDEGDKDDEDGEEDESDKDDEDDKDDTDDEDEEEDIVVPNTGLSTIVNGGATATISLFAIVILAAFVFTRRSRR